MSRSLRKSWPLLQRRRPSYWLFGRWAGVLIVSLGSVAAQMLEYEVKAAFLLNFTRFIEWPPSSTGKDSPFSLCILGDDPFGPTIDQIVAGEKVDGRPLTVKRVGREKAGSCQILYIGKGEKDVSSVLSGVGPGVLTAGEGDEFLQQGGDIAFVLDDRKVRFDISQTAARKAGLKISSRLLKVARSVK